MKILLPTDFSENSRNAVTYALSFFEMVKVDFYFIHVSVLEKKITDANLFSKTKTDANAINDSCAKLQAEVVKAEEATKSKNHIFKAIHEDAYFVEAIRKHVEDKRIDYIVMATKGVSQKKSSTLGSHTCDVITRVKCPVLVVPEDAIYRKPKSIVFPTDFNIVFKDKVLNTISEVLNIKKAVISVLYISRKPNGLSPFQKRNRNYLKDYLETKLDTCYELSNDNIELALQTFIESKEVDMVAMVAKNLNFFQHILFRPKVTNASYQTKIPFLILHE